MKLSGAKLTKKTISNWKIKLGIIGGSGLCHFSELDVFNRISIKTKYGCPSDDVSIASYNKENIAFIPRHGYKHNLPPHKIPYKANIAALKEIGVQHIIATSICGSLKKVVSPGSVVIPDQFVNLTWGRDDSFDFDKNIVHLPMSEPYCNHLRKILTYSSSKYFPLVFEKGTVVVIQGPRFSTIAESKWYIGNSWDIVNMTQYPECYFAKELGICYATIATITDYDVGIEQGSYNIQDADSFDFVQKIFIQNINNTKKTIFDFLDKESKSFACKCAHNLVKLYY